MTNEIPLWLTALNAALVPFCIYVGIRCLRSGDTFLRIIAVLNFGAAALNAYQVVQRFI